jgi:hypothetical protein
MANQLTVLEVFNNAFEAELARERLKAAGIEAFVFKDDAGGTRPELQFTSGVRLMVAEENMELAGELLHSAGSDPAKNWTCSGCSESIEGQFSECWQCGTVRK